MTSITQLQQTLAHIDKRISDVNSELHAHWARCENEIDIQISEIKQSIKRKYAPAGAELQKQLDLLREQRRPIFDEATSIVQHPDEGQLFVSWETKCPPHSFRAVTRPIWYRVTTLRTDEDVNTLEGATNRGRRYRQPKRGQTILRRVDAKGKNLKGWQHYSPTDCGFSLRPVSAIRPLPKDTLLDLGSWPKADAVWPVFAQHGVLD